MCPCRPCLGVGRDAVDVVWVLGVQVPCMHGSFAHSVEDGLSESLLSCSSFGIWGMPPCAPTPTPPPPGPAAAARRGAVELVLWWEQAATPLHPNHHPTHPLLFFFRLPLDIPTHPPTTPTATHTHPTNQASTPLSQKCPASLPSTR